MLVADEPEATGLDFDAWEIHPELQPCYASGSADADSGESHSEGSEGGEHSGEG